MLCRAHVQQYLFQIVDTYIKLIRGFKHIRFHIGKRIFDTFALQKKNGLKFHEDSLIKYLHYCMLPMTLHFLRQKKKCVYIVIKVIYNRFGDFLPGKNSLSFILPLSVGGLI